MTYLFHAQQEHDYIGTPITVLYLTPNDRLDTSGLFPDNCEPQDEDVIHTVSQALGMRRITDWTLESYGAKPEMVTEWLTDPTRQHQFMHSQRLSIGHLPAE